MPRTKSVFFGPSPDEGYDNGVRPCCAVNAQNNFIAIHEGTTSSSLNARLGQIQGLELKFDPNPTTDFTSGYNPSVAINNSNVVVEVHGSKTGNSGYLFYSVGTVDSKKRTVKFNDAVAIGKNDHAYDPSIALNEAGDLVEVHISNSEQSSALYYRRGRLQGTTVTWPEKALDLKGFPNDQRTIGNSPSVAMNNQGQIIAVYENSAKLYYLRGDLQPQGAIRWRQPIPYDPKNATEGRDPSVALGDDGTLYEVHTVAERKLIQRVGRVTADPAIVWQDWLEPGKQNYNFDQGRRIQIATNGKVALQVHQSQAYRVVYANASLPFDRANWMGDYRGKILERTLKDLALPASHDSGAYMSGGPLDDAAQTQDLTIYGQLAAGVRYFDLRPAYRGDSKVFDSSELYTWHQPVLGPKFTTVLKDVHDFMQEHNELVILKLSHYDSHFNQVIFDGMIKLLKNGDKANPNVGLDTWLFTGAASKRLADRPLQDYLQTDRQEGRGTVLVVVDSDGPHNPDNKPADVDYLAAAKPRPPGIFSYRDWYATDPQAGDLTVFDIYGNTANFDKMSTGTANDPDDKRAVRRNGTRLPQGQLPKNRWFRGVCRNQYTEKGVKKDWPCDLFLLSWTLTPTGGGAFDTSREASQRLASFMAVTPDKNPQGLRINLLYTDAVEYSRSVDVSLIRNGLS